jgi:quercetin dioxygenase-like cupin family protein
MKLLTAACGISLAVLGMASSDSCDAQGSSALVQLTPAEMKWRPFPTFPPGLQIAPVYGEPGKPGLFVLHVKYPPDYRLPPHWHPAEHVATVISGTFYFGLGEKFDPAELRRFPAGSVFNEPAHKPHFAATREEEVILQVTGVGPTATQYVNAAEDPRKK